MECVVRGRRGGGGAVACGRDAARAPFNMRVSCARRIKQSTDVRSNSSPHSTHTHPAFISSSSDAAAPGCWGCWRSARAVYCRAERCRLSMCVVSRLTGPLRRRTGSRLAPARDLSAFDLLRQSSPAADSARVGASLPLPHRDNLELISTTAVGRFWPVRTKYHRSKIRKKTL